MAPRKKVNIPIKIFKSSLENGTEIVVSEYSGKSIDLSYKGIKIATHASLAVGDVVDLEFSLSKVSKELQVRARVINVLVRSGIKNIGLEFLAPDPTFIKYLKGILILYKP